MKFLKINELVEITGASRASIYRWEKQGKFPQRRQVSQGRVGWIESEIKEWMATRPVGLGQQQRNVVMKELAETASEWDEEKVEKFNEAAREAYEKDRD